MEPADLATLEGFRAACGVRGPLILDVEERVGEGLVRRVFEGPALIVGSDPRADLRLDQPEVSRRHVLLLPVTGRLYCVDLDSRTGTGVGSGPSTVGWTVPDQPIEVGLSRLWVRSGIVPEMSGSPFERSPMAQGSVGPALGYAVSLKIASRSPSASILLSRTLTLIGGSPRCKIRLKSPKSSRFLAALLQTPTGLWVVDLRSSTPIEINGVQSAIARLEEGDELRAGPFIAIVGYSEPNSPTVDPPTEGTVLDRHRQVDRYSSDVLPVSHPASLDLQPLLEQIAGIQQQSSDQFGQVMLMVTQLFGAMHREMVDLVREELEQVRRLAGEIHSIQDGSSRKMIRSNSGLPETRLDPGPKSQYGFDDSVPADPPRNPADVHQIVSERLAAFEIERQGRWTKLSKLLLKTNH